MHFAVPKSERVIEFGDAEPISNNLLRLQKNRRQAATSFSYSAMRGHYECFASTEIGEPRRSGRV